MTLNRRWCDVPKISFGLNKTYSWTKTWRNTRHIRIGISHFSKEQNLTGNASGSVNERQFDKIILYQIQMNGTFDCRIDNDFLIE